ncbi:GntR family transcriptional regulator [Natronosporangium hydrolyticum]|uniref:GntR family transcriptional regulator n=1 Tax=Natronosporangium hydrolyticum TaxID=2811111 RepID=A0A895YFC7_9ACTN|nr:GntR family transcriptional regulator [Natronosporangium hydrolyticum]QSB14149.1 GntR family transcriptional regulator [Natronosporangium hydrolyticum]
MSSPRPPLEPSESRTRQVARNIRTDIEAGVLRHGDVLPSTRELATEWGVSPFTISEAMKLLAADGLVLSRSRAKRVVNAPAQARRTEIRGSTPHVIVIGGYAGSGKTELGRILVRETGWPLLDKDTLTRPVVETALESVGRSPHDRDSDYYMKEIRPREYEALAAATKENVECGNSAIVTAPFIREFSDDAWVKRIQAVHSAMNATTTFVWVYCDPETMHTYLRRRGAARDSGKLSDWPGYLSVIDVDFRPSVPYHLIDNSEAAAPLHDQARELVRTVMADNIGSTK